MRATAWWAATLLWMGWAAFVAHAWEVVSPVYHFTGTAGESRDGDIVQVQIIRLDPMPKNIPYNAYVPWGPFQDFETNYEQVVVPWPQTPGFGNYLDGIYYPNAGFTTPRFPGQRYPQPYPVPGHGYPGRGHHGAPHYPRPGSAIRLPCYTDLDSIQMPSPSFTAENYPRLPSIGQMHVRMPSGAVAMPWCLEYADLAGVRLGGVRMPNLGGDCGPSEPSGPTIPLSVMRDTLCNVRMPSPGFRGPNPGYRMTVLPRPVISIENTFGINVGSSPRGWDPSDQWYFPDTCVPQSVSGRVTAPVFEWMP